ncbi:hypothetical protein BD310DRAFT_939442 [Dichomitus squalens]|nr:hypothetical protein BD310DRAFT_939442 [Dichomitus squalens]
MSTTVCQHATPHGGAALAIVAFLSTLLQTTCLLVTNLGAARAPKSANDSQSPYSFRKYVAQVLCLTPMHRHRTVLRRVVPWAVVSTPAR